MLRNDHNEVIVENGVVKTFKDFSVSWLDKYSEMVNENLKIKPEDTQDDLGIWICGKCHEPMQMLRADKKMKVYIPCKCDREKTERSTEDEKRRDFSEQVEKTRAEAFPFPSMRSIRFQKGFDKLEQKSVVDRTIAKYAIEFGEKLLSGDGLIIGGLAGVGKTHMSICIGNFIIDNGFTCKFTSTTRIVRYLQGHFNEQDKYFEYLSKFDLLIIDDLGIERGTDFMVESVSDIINMRYEAKKPMVITTNVDLYNVSKRLECHDESQGMKIATSRIFSRIFEVCLPVMMRGPKRKINSVIGEADQLYDENGW